VAINPYHSPVFQAAAEDDLDPRMHHATSTNAWIGISANDRFAPEAACRAFLKEQKWSLGIR
jgi:hypothetical protein